MRSIDILLDDIQAVSSVDYIPWSKLENKTVYITGGTGLIGSMLIKSLLAVNAVYQLNLKILALVRNLDKAKDLLGEENRYLRYILGTVESLPEVKESIDFIVHSASPTDSSFFVDHPVELIDISIRGTTNVLDLAKNKFVEGMTYLSTMEVYGTPYDDMPLDEAKGFDADSMVVRNSYPLAKRICENLCASYGREYGVHCNVVRLAQTFGPGVVADDQRFFAEVARAVIHNKDIVLQTTGTSKRCYLYTVDAVTAILTVLLKGASGEAYNAANPSTYTSIVEMASMVIRDVAHNAIQLHVPIENSEASYKYMSNHYLNLDITKLKSLGWEPTRDLVDMFARMIDTMKGG